MGIELDVLVGHPEHELIFVATQVTKAAGYANAGTRAADYAKVLRNDGSLITLGDIAGQTLNYSVCGPRDSTGRLLQKRAPMVTETQVYQMLLRGHAPASEPFRKWVTEEVLPTIRKTGRYDASESSDPIALGIMDELKALRGELVELKEIVKALGIPTGAIKALLSTRI